jgi:hypothetical protein
MRFGAGAGRDGAVREDVCCASSSASRSITCCGIEECGNVYSETLHTVTAEEMTAIIEKASRADLCASG